MIFIHFFNFYQNLSSKKGSIWCEQDLDWDSTVTCFCRLGQNLWRCNFPTEKYRSEQNSKFQAKVGNSSNDWDCADGLQLSAVLLLFIRCNCNSAHLIKTRCHIAKRRVSAKVIQMGAADEIACPLCKFKSLSFEWKCLSCDSTNTIVNKKWASSDFEVNTRVNW